MRLTLPLLSVISVLAIGLSGRSSAQSSDRVDFARDIQPLLRANCYGCHNATLSSGNFRLDRRRDSMPNRVGANNARIVPGKSDESRLYQRISGTQAGLQMPPTGTLKPDEIRTIKDWIDQGADWPDALAGETPSPAQDPVATSLLDAIRRGDRGSVTRLLKQSPNAARANGSGGITPLMYAALYGDTESARLLLDIGADPNAGNDAGATALLEQAQPKSTEDHVYLVLGLTWAGASRAAIGKAANALIAQQRADGGWSQIASLSSDAYATGQALTALAQSGALKPTDPIYERGVRFLLDTQRSDGSSYVHSRVIPIKPYFDSQFTYGKDQFISAAATNWATMALTWAVR